MNRLHNNPRHTVVPFDLSTEAKKMMVACQWSEGPVFHLTVQRKGNGWVVSEAPFPIEGTKVGFYTHKQYPGNKVMKVLAKPKGAWCRRWTCLFWATGGPHHEQYSKFLAEKSERDLETQFQETNKLL